MSNLELNFTGKEMVRNHHHIGVPFREIIPVAKKSLTKEPGLDDNLIIKGDNLHALKALLPHYAGKVKCIYIDPPYNTGNEKWCYNDNVNSTKIREWLKQSAHPVDGEDMLRHDKWLCMIWPRLQLLRELLSDDGVIFISIDDNEQHRLRAIMDEIFGEGNFVANVIWQKKFSPQNDAKWFSDNHDFVVCYSKDKENWRPNLLVREDKHNERYTNPDNDPRGVWASSGLDVRTYQKEYDYPIKTPSGRIVNPPKGRSWAQSKAKFEEHVKDNRVWFGEKGSNVPRIKKFLSEVKQGITPLTVWLYEEVGHNQGATQELKSIETPVFQSPKPVNLLRKIISIGADKDSIILDSFAGSGTTAHATLALNKEDGGNRKFILVEMEDYADKITAERVRRVIKGVPKAKDEALKAGLGGSFTYCELGDEFDIEGMLSGKSLPSYETLASYIFKNYTGQVLDKKKKIGKDFFIGQTEEYEVYLIYKPDIEFLQSNESSLTYKNLEIITKIPSKKKKLVFATALYVDSDNLKNIEFCLLPYAINKIVG